MKGVLPRVGLIFKTNLGSRRGFQTKIYLIYLSQKRIVIQTLGLKREEVEIYQVASLSVQCFVKSIGVDAWWEWEISLDVGYSNIRLGFSLM